MHNTTNLQLFTTLMSATFNCVNYDRINNICNSSTSVFAKLSLMASWNCRSHLYNKLTVVHKSVTVNSPCHWHWQILT